MVWRHARERHMDEPRGRASALRRANYRSHSAARPGLERARIAGVSNGGDPPQGQDRLHDPIALHETPGPVLLRQQCQQAPNAEEYLESLEILRSFPWYRAPKPADEYGRELWRNRAGLTDAIFYEPRSEL